MPDKLKPYQQYIYPFMGVYFVIVSFFGFSQSYYLSDSRGELSLDLHIHALLASLWLLLWLVQSLLVFGRKLHIHKKVGVAGFVVFLGLVPLMFYSILMRVQEADPPYEVGRDLVQWLVFVVLGAWAFWKRGEPAVHKRLMVFATLDLTTAAVGRIGNIYFPEYLGIGVFFYMILFVPAFLTLSHDRITLGRFHRSSLYALYFVIVSRLVLNPTQGAERWQKLSEVLRLIFLS